MTTFLAGVGGPGSASIASGGKVTPVNNVSNVASAQVIGKNPQRQSITFWNPGTVTLYIGPMTDVNGNPFTPTLAALGGTFPLFAGGGPLTITGECQTAYQAIAASGTTNPLTIMESNF